MNELKQARLNAGLTQEQVHDIIGVPVRSIQHWEAGTRKPPEYVVKLIVDKLSQIEKGSK